MPQTILDRKVIWHRTSTTDYALGQLFTAMDSAKALGITRFEIEATESRPYSTGDRSLVRDVSLIAVIEVEAP